MPHESAREAPAQSKRHASGEEAFNSGDYTTAVECFQMTLNKYEKLRYSKKRKDSVNVVAKCKMNIAAAKTCTRDLKRDGLRELRKLATENHDKSFLGTLHYNIALADPPIKQYQDLDKALAYLPDPSASSDETSKEGMKMKEDILERMIEIQNHPSDDHQSSEAHEAKFRLMEELADAYTVHLANVPNENYAEKERLVHKCSNILTVLAFQHLHKRQKAKMYANRCFNLFQRNDGHILAELWNDLGLICTEIGDNVRAKNCFSKVVPFLRSAESSSEVSTAGLQNMGVVCLLDKAFSEAVHCFKYALTLLKKTDVKLAIMTERRAHLYLNIGVAWGSMGRDHVWKTFEAYYNAAVFASRIESEEILRRDALHGLIGSAMLILNYGNNLDDFLVNVVFKDLRVPEMKQNVCGFDEREDVQAVVKYVRTFDVALRNIKVRVLSMDD